MTLFERFGGSGAEGKGSAVEFESSVGELFEVGLAERGDDSVSFSHLGFALLFGGFGSPVEGDGLFDVVVRDMWVHVVWGMGYEVWGLGDVQSRLFR